MGKMPLAFCAKQNDFGSMTSPISDKYPGLKHQIYFAQSQLQVLVKEEADPNVLCPHSHCS